MEVIQQEARQDHMMRWVKDNWQFVTAMAMIAGWAVTNWTSYQVMQAENSHKFGDAAAHRGRIELAQEQADARVDKMEKQIQATRERLTEINTRQQTHTETLNKIDKKLDRALRPRRQPK